jgi:hypothetical protein
MSLTPIPTNNLVTDGQGRLQAVWQTFMESVNYWLRPLGQSGTTATRPLDSSGIQLYIGQMYFDTTLGKPIWVKSRNPTVWVDATGAAV